MRQFSMLMFVALALPALGADQPGRMIKTWGEVIDPDKDCDISAEGDRLTIKVPGKPHDLSVELDRLNAPRVLREIKGDFIAQVKVGGTVKPSGDALIEGRTSFNGAGILLWKDNGTYIRLERAALARGDELRHYMNFELRKDAKEAPIPAQEQVRDLPDQATYLRLERRGKQIIASTSQDGIQWQSWSPLVDELPLDLKIGVDAINSASGPFTAEFSDFQLFSRAAEILNKPDQPAAPDVKSGSDAKQVGLIKSGLEGTWKVVGQKNEDEADYRNVPYVHYKILADGHFMWASYTAATGEILRAAGGTYSVDGDTYTERLEYANSSDLRGLIGQDLKFSWKRDGDKWRHSGQLANGSKVDELWERVK